MSDVRAPVKVRCRWRFTRAHKMHGTALRNVYVCQDCRMWTANEPLYRYGVCPRKDRRKRQRGRRAGDR